MGAREITMESDNGKSSESGIEVLPYHHTESHTDTRGWVLFPWKGIELAVDLDTLHIVHIAPGATRGNHFHPEAMEWICTIEGEGLLTWRGKDEETVHELHLEAQRTCVKIPPGIRHAVTNIGSGELLLVAVREKRAAGDKTIKEDI